MSVFYNIATINSWNDNAINITVNKTITSDENNKEINMSIKISHLQH